MYRIELEHVGKIIRIKKIVDTYNFDVVREILNGSTENHTADTAKSVNTKFYHCYKYLMKFNFLLCVQVRKLAVFLDAMPIPAKTVQK